jgi:hypothetical protein
MCFLVSNVCTFQNPSNRMGIFMLFENVEPKFVNVHMNRMD